MATDVPDDGALAGTEAATADPRGFSGGERVQLTDAKGRKHTVVLEPGKRFHTSHGGIDHDDLIGRPEGIVVTSTKGTAYLALRPLLSDFVLSMPRGAAVIYPKDAATIVALADVFPGSTVVEAGTGSGALCCSLLRAVGESGHVISFERREDFAAVARKNIANFFGGIPDAADLRVGGFDDSGTDLQAGSVDRIVLDMLAPWESLGEAARVLRPGGVVCCYVATTTQMSRAVETMRAAGCWTEPDSMEILMRTWHVEGLAVRPDHRMIGHTGFLVIARRLTDGTTLPTRRSRPAKGAYGADYTGPGSTAPEGATHD